MIRLSFILTMLGLNLTSYSQSREKVFEMNYEELPKFQESKYKTILLVDNRIEKGFMGFVQVGGFNAIARVATEIPLQIQLDKTLKLLSSGYLTEDTIVLHLNHINFAEVTGALSEKGYVNLTAELYAMKNEMCYKLAGVDSTFEVKGLDVTNKMLKHGSMQVINLLAKNIIKSRDEAITPIPLHTLIYKDSLEKSTIPLYINEEYTNGAYTSFESFKNQVPDTQIEVEYHENGKIDKILGSKFKKEIDISKYYGFVINGKPYISIKHHIHQLYKNSSNTFYFIGRAPDGGKTTTNAALASMGFGLIGGVLYLSLAGDAQSKFMMMLDHENGNKIPVRKMPNDYRQ
jgi:hypothetical protein